MAGRLTAHLLCIHIKDREDPVQVAGIFPKNLLEDFANHILAKWPGMIRVHIEELSDEERDLLARKAKEVLRGT